MVRTAFGSLKWATNRTKRRASSLSVTGAPVDALFVCGLSVVDLLAMSLHSDTSSLVLDGLERNGLAMLGVAVVGAGATYVSTSTLEIVGQRIGLDMRKRLFNNIMDQDLEFFDVNKSGELANRLSTGRW